MHLRFHSALIQSAMQESSTNSHPVEADGGGGGGGGGGVGERPRKSVTARQTGRGGGLPGSTPSQVDGKGKEADATRRKAQDGFGI